MKTSSFRRTSENAGMGNMKPHNQYSQTLLLVDDHPDILKALVTFLEKLGFDIIIARNGEEAIERATHVMPDLILLDVIMPGINGFETCRRLKTNERTHEIPIIFMTALSETVNKVKGFEMGGVDYVTKPLQYEEVLARINAHLLIRTQQRQLQELNASKDKFFSIIAHELKSPVAGFLELAHLLESIERLKPEQIQRLTRQFRQSAEHLLTLLENLLTWSRLQHGLIECHPDWVPIRKIVERNCHLLNSTACQKQITLTVMVPESIGAYVDLNMIDTVIRNVLSNAIKFTKPEGTITITARPEGNLIRISVTDTGIGIPAEKLTELFRIDARTQREGTAGERGTGLGLLLCKEFVEKHGGTIMMESQEGQGSTLSFTVPAVA